MLGSKCRYGNAMNVVFRFFSWASVGLGGDAGQHLAIENLPSVQGTFVAGGNQAGALVAAHRRVADRDVRFEWKRSSCPAV